MVLQPLTLEGERGYATFPRSHSQCEQEVSRLTPNVVLLTLCQSVAPAQRQLLSLTGYFTYYDNSTEMAGARESWGVLAVAVVRDNIDQQTPRNNADRLPIKEIQRTAAAECYFLALQKCTDFKTINGQYDVAF